MLAVAFLLIPFLQLDGLDRIPGNLGGGRLVVIPIPSISNQDFMAKLSQSADFAGLQEPTIRLNNVNPKIASSNPVAQLNQRCRTSGT